MDLLDIKGLNGLFQKKLYPSCMDFHSILPWISFTFFLNQHTFFSQILACPLELDRILPQPPGILPQHGGYVFIKFIQFLAHLYNHSIGRCPEPFLRELDLQIY